MMRQLRFLMLFAMLAGHVAFAVDVDGHRQPITANFINIKTRDLIQLLAEKSGKSVIISEKVNGKINIDLHSTSWREALDIVLQMQNLVKRETANAIFIAPVGELSNREVQLEAFNLSHASADSVSKMLGSAGALSQSGKAGAELRTNQLVVADTSDKVAALKNLLKQVDIPVRQVEIEAKVVSADENFVRELGVEFGTVQAQEGSNTNDALHNGKFNFTIAKLNNRSLLDLKLAALENEGRGQVISSPKLLTADRQAAYIESGAEIPYQEKTKEGDTSIAFKKAVLSLKVTPEVVTDAAVNLLLQLNQDKVSQLTVNGVPAIDTRKIQTQVLVHDGETIVLGGIYEWSKSRYIVGIPVLKNIPLLGVLFRKQEHKMERKELLMFVTPHIVHK